MERTEIKEVRDVMDFSVKASIGLWWIDYADENYNYGNWAPHTARTAVV